MEKKVKDYMDRVLREVRELRKKNDLDDGISDAQIIAFALDEYKVVLSKRLEKYNNWKEKN